MNKQIDKYINKLYNKHIYKIHIIIKYVVIMNINNKTFQQIQRPKNNKNSNYKK